MGWRWMQAKMWEVAEEERRTDCGATTPTNGNWPAATPVI